MSPPPPRRSSAGKGRGRAGRGNDRRLCIENMVENATKRERGTSSNNSSSSSSRGRGGGTSLLVSSSSSSLAPTAASVRPTRTVTTVLKKVVVRNLPATVTAHEVKEMLEAHGVKPECLWRFVPGSQRKNNRDPVPGRLYLDLKKEPAKATKLIAGLHGQHVEADGQEKKGPGKPLDVEFAPFQKIPREKQRKDAKMGTIDRDPDYVAFLDELAKPQAKLPSAETIVDMMMAEGETVEKPVAALVKYLNERKLHSREKGKGKLGGKAIVKNARRQKGKKTGSKQKPPKDKSRTAKERKKKSNDDTVDGRSRKQHGRVSLKKESTKQEPAEPGMLRIMTPKPVAAAGDSSLTYAAKRNGTTSSIDAPLGGSAKRFSKGGKKNGSRGRTNLPKSNDGLIGGADGEGTNMKPHSRRIGGNSGKKEPSNKGGERKKKVFTPKDATAQGTPAKS